jgi:hypothetical protein
MRDINRYLTTTVLSLVLLFGHSASAMQIPQYDKMDSRDQGHYASFLVKGTIADLQAAGKKDEAFQLAEFFNDLSPNGGPAKFYQTVDEFRAANQANAADPSNKESPLEVEDAMAVTMVKHGIKDVSVDRLLEIGKNFKPAYPPAKKGK